MMVLGVGTGEGTAAAAEDKARRWSGSKRLRAAEPAAGSRRATHMIEEEGVMRGRRGWRQDVKAVREEKWRMLRRRLDLEAGLLLLLLRHRALLGCVWGVWGE